MSCLKVVFRVDASPKLGIGHIMRCLSLADILKAIEDIQIEFVCCEGLPYSLANRILNNGYKLYSIKGNTDPIEESKQFLNIYRRKKLDWVVVDHYGIDEVWESAIRPITKGIIVIDDLANRNHQCDILIDQNLYSDMHDRYNSLVPNNCKKFLGPEFSLIRKEFFELKSTVRVREKCKNVLVSFGGSDPTGEISKVLSALENNAEKFRNLFFHFVAGPANVKQEELRQRSEKLSNIKFYTQIDNMAELLSKVDLAIGGGGISLWERCFMGVPSIVIIVAENQRKAIEEAEDRQLLWNLGTSQEVTSNLIAQTLKDIILNPDSLKDKSVRTIDFLSHLRNRKMHPIISEVKKGNFSDG